MYYISTLYDDVREYLRLVSKFQTISSKIEQNQACDRLAHFQQTWVCWNRPTDLSLLKMAVGLIWIVSSGSISSFTFHYQCNEQLKVISKAKSQKITLSWTWSVTIDSACFDSGIQDILAMETIIRRWWLGWYSLVILTKLICYDAIWRTLNIRYVQYWLLWVCVLRGLRFSLQGEPRELWHFRSM